MPRMHKLDGQDAWGILTGEETGHRPFYFVYNGVVEALRDGKWKCVVPHSYRIVKTPGKDGLPGEQIAKGGNIGLTLFDMEADPKESNDMAAQHPEIAEQMYARIKEFQKEIDEEMKHLIIE